MRKLLSLIAAVCFFSASANAQINTQDAEAFVKKVTQDGIEEIINANVDMQTKDERFATLFNSALDLDFIGQFVLGRYWKGSTPKQQQDFIDAYRSFNIKTWSSRFDEFKGKTFAFEGTTPSKTTNQIFVNTSVAMDQGAPVKVVWRVQYKNNQYKIVDIIIENVSLAISARNEYTAFIKNSAEGVDGLIKNLQAKTAK